MMKQQMPRGGHRARSAFTLIELLVVIGIIGVMLSILLPALNKARRAAYTVVCSSNIHNILLAMQNYATLYNGYIAGSPETTGAFLMNMNAYPIVGKAGFSDQNCPNICGIWDWQTPLGKLMGFPFASYDGKWPANLPLTSPGGNPDHPGIPTAGDVGSRAVRFNMLMNRKEFHCPENNWLAIEYPPTSGPLDPGVVLPAPSYFTAGDFLLLPNIVVNGKWYIGSSTLITYCSWSAQQTTAYFQLPTAYGPKVSKVGDPARKIYVACGGLYGKWLPASSTPTAGQNYPSYQMNYIGSIATGNSYSDYGSFDGYSRALDRAGTNGDPTNGGIPTYPPNNISSNANSNDARLFGFRHGNLKAFGSTDSYRFNAGFFDGHVETMGDLEGADPSMWNPPNTTINQAEVMYDVQSHFYRDRVIGTFGALPPTN